MSTYCCADSMYWDCASVTSARQSSSYGYSFDSSFYIWFAFFARILYMLSQMISLYWRTCQSPGAFQGTLVKLVQMVHHCPGFTQVTSCSSAETTSRRLANWRTGLGPKPSSCRMCWLECRMGEDSRPPARGQGCRLPWAGLLEQTNGLKKAPSPAQVTKHSLIPV